MKRENNTEVETKDGSLILDSHKLSYHYERIQAWENEERIAPVCVDMALTRACGAMCFFVMQWSKSLKKEQILKLRKH